MNPMSDLVFEQHKETGKIISVKLCGTELLNESAGGQTDLIVNGLPLKTRPYPMGGAVEADHRLKGERFVDHFSGWGLVVNRQIGSRDYAKYNCTGINYLIRRELCDMTDLPCPGPGGPVNEAPLHVDSFGHQTGAGAALRRAEMGGASRMKSSHAQMILKAASPSTAQQDWMALGYGLFIHFGPNTFTAAGWGDGKFPAADFHPAELDTDQWAELAAAAGMKYAVLTTKHHDGFCLWPSRHTEYCTKNSPGRPDIVGRFVESFRKAGIRPGLYYSLWDRNYPRYEDDAAYADYMFAQIEELLTQYGPIVELWFDGGWDKDHPTRQWPYDPVWAADPHSGLTHGERWRWRELYQHIHRLQGECLVVMNSSSDRPGGIKYHPVDIRTSEHFNFIWQEEVCDPVLAPVFTDPERGEVHLPLEYCTSLNPKWFWNEGDCYGHPSVETICGWYRQARASQANFLLNAGPDKRGLMPEYHRRFLAAAANELGLKVLS